MEIHAWMNYVLNLYEHVFWYTCFMFEYNYKYDQYHVGVTFISFLLHSLLQSFMTQLCSIRTCQNGIRMQWQLCLAVSVPPFPLLCFLNNRYMYDHSSFIWLQFSWLPQKGFSIKHSKSEWSFKKCGSSHFCKGDAANQTACARGPMPLTKDPLHALNAHPARVPTLLVTKIAKIVTTIHTNRNSMLQNAFQCKKGSTNRVQQPKLNARWVKQEAVAMQRAKIVKTMLTNRNPMLQNAFQCKKGFTNQAQRPKSNAQPVKQETVATRRAKSV